MYLKGIKHNVVTKLNPLTLNVGLDGRMDDKRMDDGQKVITIAHPEHSSGELKSVAKVLVYLTLSVLQIKTMFANCVCLFVSEEEAN